MTANVCVLVAKRDASGKPTHLVTPHPAVTKAMNNGIAPPFLSARVLPHDIRAGALVSGASGSDLAVGSACVAAARMLHDKGMGVFRKAENGVSAAQSAQDPAFFVAKVLPQYGNLDILKEQLYLVGTSVENEKVCYYFVFDDSDKYNAATSSSSSSTTSVELPTSIVESALENAFVTGTKLGAISEGTTPISKVKQSNPNASGITDLVLAIQTAFPDKSLSNNRRRAEDSWAIRRPRNMNESSRPGMVIAQYAEGAPGHSIRSKL